MEDMITKKSWEEFKDSGLLWFINTTLHMFGWAIVFEVNEDGSLKECYPARVKYRGYDLDNTTEGYKQVSEYMKDNAEALYEESCL